MTNPGNETAPAVARGGGRTTQNARLGHAQVTAGAGRPLGLILARLHRVQRHGDAYRADCPLGHKSRGTLALREADDGRVLLTCHAGCGAAEVLGAIGLSLADLFDRPPVDDTREGRERRRVAATLADWRAALPILEHEACVVAIAAQRIATGTILGPDDEARVQLAHERIADARRRLA